MKIARLLENKILKVTVFLLVLTFTFILRAHNYEKVPTPAHLDEMLYAWSGVSLIREGTPVSWSTLDYPKENEVYKGEISYGGGDPKASVTLYKPWLDEPPLFSLIVGYFADRFNVKSGEFVPSSYIRFPMIFMGAITSIFVFLIARKWKGYWFGILSMLLYGTIPNMVISSRSAMPENLIALFLIVSIYILLKYRESNNNWLLVPLPILAGLAGLSKPTGYFIAPLAAFLVFYLGSRKLTFKTLLKPLLIILGTLPFLGIYLWYGNHFSSEVFKLITAIQGNRPAGFSNLMWQIISPSYGTQIFKDSWFVVSMISSIFFLMKKKSIVGKIIQITLVYWFSVIILSGGEGDLLAWYRFPYYPLLAMTMAWLLIKLVRKANFFSTFLAISLLLGSRLLLVNAFHQNLQPLPFRIIFTTLMIPPALSLLWKGKITKMVNRLLIVGIIAVGMYMNVKYIYSAYEIACQSLSCPLVPSTWLSELHLPLIWRLFVLK